LWYAVYRGYYAAGGTAFLPGVVRPGAEAEFRAINLFGAVVIAAAAALPLLMLAFWSHRWLRLAQLLVCWGIAVGCCMHALVAALQRVLSLAGLVRVDYPPLWASVDHRTADLQDLFFNEPWFLLEGLAFAAIGWVVLGPGRARRRWVGSGLAAVALLLIFGVLVITGLV